MLNSLYISLGFGIQTAVRHRVAKVEIFSAKCRVSRILREPEKWTQIASNWQFDRIVSLSQDGGGL
jgi:hypothetical protein